MNRLETGMEGDWWLRIRRKSLKHVVNEIKAREVFVKVGSPDGESFALALLPVDDSDKRAFAVRGQPVEIVESEAEKRARAAGLILPPGVQA